MSTKLILAIALGTALTTSVVSATGGELQQPGPNARVTRHVTALGTTKPSGAVLDDRLGTSLFLERRTLELSRRIRTEICSGC